MRDLNKMKDKVHEIKNKDLEETADLGLEAPLDDGQRIKAIQGVRAASAYVYGYHKEIDETCKKAIEIVENNPNLSSKDFLLMVGKAALEIFEVDLELSDQEKMSLAIAIVFFDIDEIREILKNE